MTSTGEDAMHRLVHAIVGRDDEASMSLAHRMLGSQIGISQEDGVGGYDGGVHHPIADLSSTWRRIGRKSTDPNCRADVEALYDRLERECHHRAEQQLPPRVLVLLTKLMGKRMKMPALSSNTTVLSPTRTNQNNSKSPGRPRPNTRMNASLNTMNQLEYAGPPKSDLPNSTNVDRMKMDDKIVEEKRELEIEEALLLRECLYSLQGIDGERIRYYHKHDQDSNDSRNAPNDGCLAYDGVRIRSAALTNSLLYTGRVVETRLGSGAVDALRISGEAGWLYQRINTYIQQVQHDESKGIVARAFAGNLGDELREYHSLLTQYESQMSNLTLRQLLIDLRMPTARLRILALLTDGLGHLSGGHLLTALYQHAQHGDTRHAKLVQSILCAASRPWFDILYTWTTQGVLSDPHNEFFVTERHDVDDQHLWRDKYSINKSRIPQGILEMELVAPAFNVGKGINFIRRCLLDGKWTMHLDNGVDDGTSEGGFNQDLGYCYMPHADGNIALQRTLTQAADLVHSHILRALREDNHMMQHLFALKQFLFLGQGDFFSVLMEGLHSEFREQPGVAGIYKHSLLAIVEGALRSTNAKYLPKYVLDRLQVELLLDPDDEAYGMFGPDGRTKSDTRTVWDIFILDYQIPEPLAAIVYPKALNKYKMVFSLLFSLKRVEFLLNFTWRQSATLQHALQAYGHYNGIAINTNKTYAQASYLLRKISILRQNMMHLIVNLKSYLMFEVIEGGWRRLQSEMDTSRTLDEVIEAHDQYIDGIVRKSLLRNDDSRDLNQQKLGDQVQALLRITGEFCELQERLFHDSLLSADVASQKRIEANRRANEGRWGFDSEQDITEEENFFGLANSKTLREVNRIAQIYNKNALLLLHILGDKVNSNVDDMEQEQKMVELNDAEYLGLAPRRSTTTGPEGDLDPQRFLIAQLDHNNYYSGQGLHR